jgi:hypothetical protein
MTGDAGSPATAGMLSWMRWSAVAAWVVALLVAQPSRWVEPVLILGAVQALVHVPGFAAMIAGLGSGRRAVLWLLLLFMLVGQFSRGEAYWPFLRWNMYSTRQPNPVYYEWKAMLADGGEVDFPFCRFAPGSNCRAFVFSFNWRFLEPAVMREGAESERATLDLHQALAPLVRLYNEGTDGAPIIAVEGRRIRWLFAYGQTAPAIVDQRGVVVAFEQAATP